MSDSNAGAKSPLRIIVLLLILVALAAGVYARYGIPGRGVLTIRNDSREPVQIHYLPGGDASGSGVEARLDPGTTVTTTFRKGATLEVWLGTTRPDQPAAWRLDAAGPWVLINLEQFAFRLEGDGLRAQSLTP